MSACNVRIYQLALRTFTQEGTIRAAEKMLAHIASCGFTHVQLTPVVEADDDPDVSGWSRRQCESGMENPNNNYRLKDYFRINGEYGTADDLRSFVRTAHHLGVKVILDLVYYHCGPNATLVKEHPDFIQHDENGAFRTGEWRFPILDYAQPGLREYMWQNMEHFICAYDIDGYRCDVGDRVPADFWREGIRRCRALKADFFMLNEGGMVEYLKDGFDCNYFSDCCFDSVKITSGEMSAGTFQAKWQAWREKIPCGGRLLHFVENHDVCSDAFENRFEKIYGSDAMEVQQALIFTLDGVPFVFNGNELADTLKHSMFSNRFHGRDNTLQWENALCKNGMRRMALIRGLNALRDTYECLNGDSLEWVRHDCPESMLAYIRPGTEKNLLVILNLREKPVEALLEIPREPLEIVLQQNAKLEYGLGSTKVQLLGYGYLIAEI